MNRLRIYPDPALRDKANKVTNFDPSCLGYVIQIMKEGLKKYRAAGIAANQLGILQQILLANIGKGDIVLINPEIIEHSGEIKEEEGCISFPGVEIEVPRAKTVVVRGFDEQGEQRTIEAVDLLARVFQHEIDHLNSVLIVDKLNPMERLEFERQWKRGEYEGKNPSTVL